MEEDAEAQRKIAEEEARPKPPPGAPPGWQAPLIVIQTSVETLGGKGDTEVTTNEMPEQIYSFEPSAASSGGIAPQGMQTYIKPWEKYTRPRKMGEPVKTDIDEETATLNIPVEGNCVQAKIEIMPADAVGPEPEWAEKETF